MTDYQSIGLALHFFGLNQMSFSTSFTDLGATAETSLKLQNFSDPIRPHFLYCNAIQVLSTDRRTTQNTSQKVTWTSIGVSRWTPATCQRTDATSFFEYRRYLTFSRLALRIFAAPFESFPMVPLTHHSGGTHQEPYLEDQGLQFSSFSERMGPQPATTLSMRW